MTSPSRCLTSKQRMPLRQPLLVARELLSTSAIASGLNRLFGAPVSGGALSREGHQSNVSGQYKSREWMPLSNGVGPGIWTVDAEMRFPSLFCLAMDVLPTQASSVPCELLFSSGKETYTAHRNRIRPNGSSNLTEHLSSGFYPLEGESGICEALEIVYNTEYIILNRYLSTVCPESDMTTPRGIWILCFQATVISKPHHIYISHKW